MLPGVPSSSFYKPVACRRPTAFRPASGVERSFSLISRALSFCMAMSMRVGGVGGAARGEIHVRGVCGAAERYQEFSAEVLCEVRGGRGRVEAGYFAAERQGAVLVAGQSAEVRRHGADGTGGLVGADLRDAPRFVQDGLGSGEVAGVDQRSGQVRRGVHPD